MARRSTRSGLAVGLLAALAGVAAGCADVRVSKVTAQNDCQLDGFRYYLPRPYVVLKKPAPIAGDQFVVSGTVLEGGAIQVDSDALPEFLKFHFRKSAEGHALIPYEDVIVPVRGGARPSADTAPPPPSKAVVGSPSDAHDDPTADVLNLNSEDLAVVYLPDFDEQYSIKFVAGLGRVDTGTNGLRLRHGWMLEGINVAIDNTKLGEFIFNQVDKFTDVASLVAAKKNQVGDKFTPSAAGDTNKRLTLRISYVVEAQKGIYPILKPCEREHYLQTCCETQGTPVSASSHGQVFGKDWVFLPYPPFTVIAFSVKRSVAIELVSVSTGAVVASPMAAGPAALDEAGQVLAWVEANRTKIEGLGTKKVSVDTSLDHDWVLSVEGITPAQAETIRASVVTLVRATPPRIGKDTLPAVQVVPR